MKEFLLIGKDKKPLNLNYNDKCSYLKNLQKREKNSMRNIEKKKAEIILQKIKNDGYQRDYSFYSFNKLGVKKAKKIQKTGLLPQLKYSFSSPEERFRLKNPEEDDEYVKIYKKQSIHFPRALEKYLMSYNNRQIKPTSFLCLPKLY